MGIKRRDKGVPGKRDRAECAASLNCSVAKSFNKKEKVNTTLNDKIIHELSQRLDRTISIFDKHYPGESGMRQPVHTVYGGAHLFKADTPQKLGSLALRSLETYAPNEETFAQVLGINEKFTNVIYERITSKLTTEAVEDLRIDFEDGYGVRTDDEEDGHAVNAAHEMAKALENSPVRMCQFDTS